MTETSSVSVAADLSIPVADQRTWRPAVRSAWFRPGHRLGFLGLARPYIRVEREIASCFPLPARNTDNASYPTENPTGLTFKRWSGQTPARLIGSGVSSRLCRKRDFGWRHRRVRTSVKAGRVFIQSSFPNRFLLSSSCSSVHTHASVRP
jgi:hypothetical protein